MAKEDYYLEKRKYVLGGAVIIIVLVFIIRLFALQIMSEDYKKYADVQELPLCLKCIVFVY